MLQRLDNVYSLPTTQEVYDFARELFLKAQLGAECIIVSLVYIERLMETAGVVLLVNNWRTIVLCALLLASKVWQDLSSWNVEFSIVYPQYTLDAINRLERAFVQQLRYKLYISGEWLMNGSSLCAVLMMLSRVAPSRKRVCEVLLCAAVNG